MLGDRGGGGEGGLGGVGTRPFKIGTKAPYKIQIHAHTSTTECNIGVKTLHSGKI